MHVITNIACFSCREAFRCHLRWTYNPDHIQVWCQKPCPCHHMCSTSCGAAQTDRPLTFSNTCIGDSSCFLLFDSFLELLYLMLDDSVPHLLGLHHLVKVSNIAAIFFLGSIFFAQLLCSHFLLTSAFSKTQVSHTCLLQTSTVRDIINNNNNYYNFIFI